MQDDYVPVWDNLGWTTGQWTETQKFPEVTGYAHQTCYPEGPPR